MKSERVHGRARIAAAWLLAGLGACGGEETPASPERRTEVFVAQAARFEAAPTLRPTRTATLASNGTIVLGTDGSARPVVAVDEAVYVLSGTTLERRRLFAGSGEPSRLGDVRALRPRSAGGAWLASSAGLFVVEAQYVLLVAEIGPVLDVHEVAAGPLAGVWLLTSEALLLSLPTELARFDIPGTTGAYTDLAVDPQGRRALVVAGQEVLSVEPAGDGLVARALAFDPGVPRELAATAEALWLAASRGLFALPLAGSTSGWIRVDGPEGPLDAIAVEADASQVYVLEASGRLAALGLDGPSAEVLLPSAGSGPFAADGRGGLWVLRGPSALEGFRLEAAPRFERDIRAFIETHCAACHGSAPSDYRVYENFVGRADRALERIRRGDMPRCENDAPCPEDRQLTPATYGILEQWIEEGMLR